MYELKYALFLHFLVFEFENAIFNDNGEDGRAEKAAKA